MNYYLLIDKSGFTVDSLPLLPPVMEIEYPNGKLKESKTFQDHWAGYSEKREVFEVLMVSRNINAPTFFLY